MSAAPAPLPIQHRWEHFDPEDDRLEKRMYDIRLRGGRVLRGCWPNAAYFYCLADRSGREVLKTFVTHVRKSDPCEYL